MNTPVSAPVVTITLDTAVGTLYEDGEPVGAVGIGDLIVNNATDRLVTELLADLREEVRRFVIARADEQVTELVREMVASVLAEPFRITDRYGGAGQPTTIRERIAEQVAAEMKPSRRDGYHHDRDRSVITAVIEDEVKKALTTELSGVVKEARDKVVTSVRNNAAEIIAQAVKDGLR